MTLVTVLAVKRRDHPSAPGDDQLASIEQHGDRVLIVLDDGLTLDFNADELAQASRRTRFVFGERAA